MTDYSNYENWFYEDQFLEDDEDILEDREDIKVELTVTNRSQLRRSTI